MKKTIIDRTVNVAIVYDWLVLYGGADRAVEQMHQLFPNAPIYTSIFDKKRMPENFALAMFVYAHYKI